MGGGFGSKFGADVWGRTAAELAKKARPAGQDVPRPRPGAPRRAATARAPPAKVKLGATKDGKLVAMVAETHGTGGSRGGSNFPLPYVYDVPASSRTHTDVFVNAGGARAMRAAAYQRPPLSANTPLDSLGNILLP